MSTFGMYFPTSAGRSLRLPITSDSTAYFITDRPVRAERIGLVVMDTPSHGPLASTFGRQLLDLGEMPASDSPACARAMMDLLAKSDVSRAGQLRPGDPSYADVLNHGNDMQEYPDMARLKTLTTRSNDPAPESTGFLTKALARQLPGRAKPRQRPARWKAFSPASTRMGRRFCAGGRGQVAKEVKAQGGL
ncbi:MAG: hypothetical protein HYZ28_07210 [Myxococcales bacterium]|nr:hypothetical protein [Myxococcales bacterium]